MEFNVIKVIDREQYHNVSLEAVRTEACPNCEHRPFVDCNAKLTTKVASLLLIAAMCLLGSIGFAQEGVKADMFRLHNSARPFPFRYDAQLDVSAQQYADYLDRVNGEGHSADGRSPGQRMTAAGYRASTWGENMAEVSATPEPTFRAWMNSRPPIEHPKP